MYTIGNKYNKQTQGETSRLQGDFGRGGGLVSPKGEVVVSKSGRREIIGAQVCRPIRARRIVMTTRVRCVNGYRIQ